MRQLRTARLRIGDQNRFLNEIAGTYKDFYRAAMEYIDNSIDAAEALKRKGKVFSPKVSVVVNSREKTVSFIDNCGGMNPNELCNLVEQVGESKKKAAWANGKFGFGVHAFRGFAKKAMFISCSDMSQGAARIEINREYDETKLIPCLSCDANPVDEPGTVVKISEFNPKTFKKNEFAELLKSEIECHFDDVIRSNLVEITIHEGGHQKRCECFNYDSMSGVPLRVEEPIQLQGSKHNMIVDLKVLDVATNGRPAILSNKGRRVQAIGDLKSFKDFLKQRHRSISLWSNPLVVGSIEIDDLCSPNLSRNELKDGPGRERLFECLLGIQDKLEKIVKEQLARRTNDTLKEASSLVTECLAKVLSQFTLPSHRSFLTSQEDGPLAECVSEDESAREPAISVLSNKLEGREGETGTGENGSRDFPLGYKDNNSTLSPTQPRIFKSNFPLIEFGTHGGAERVIAMPDQLIIDVEHPDFKARNEGRSGKIRFDARMLNYLALVIGSSCVSRLLKNKESPSDAVELAERLVQLTVRFEESLASLQVGDAHLHCK